MLIEVLPFLRDIASKIQTRLGDEHPGLVPTVFAAYALTSFLVGAVFSILGVFRCGRLVDQHMPSREHIADERRRLITSQRLCSLVPSVGTQRLSRNTESNIVDSLGAIGVSLFILALELTLPPTAPALDLASAGHVLFNDSHLPLLFASVIPALFLSLSIRLPILAKASLGFTDHALYVPTYMFIIVGLFWAVVAGTSQANKAGMRYLADLGWLFTVQIDVAKNATHHQAWNYWASFDFPQVQWSAMTAAIQDIVLLVVIGVLNLPIYIPTMALTLDVSKYDMDHEFLGHGVSNLLAGVVGTIPNLVVCIYFTFALP